MKFIHSLVKLINSPFIFLIRLYQLSVSPLLPKNCRFTPSCSEYTIQAFKKYVFYKALYLALKRIIKCHPYHPGGHDPLK
jgi:putative membrane protein insertion efficiency factor